MNIPAEFYEAQLKASLTPRLTPLRRLNGSVEILAACDTLQFPQYSAYHAGMFNEAHKRAVHQSQFPRDLAAAFALGQKLTAGR